MSLLMVLSASADKFQHMAKGDLFLKQGNLNSAIREYEKAIAEAPNFVEAYNSLGLVYQYEIKDYSKAIEVYSKGLTIAPNNYSLNINIMYSYFSERDIDNGIKHYETLSTIRAEHKRYYFPWDAINEITKHMNEEEVIDFCKRYLVMNPTDLTLREILVDIYKNRREYKKAEIQLQAMLQYGDERGSVYFDLGTCNYNLGRKKKALEFFIKAQELGTHVPQGFFDKLHKEIEEE
jgi:tetratricopeptide (TPR) repeat protein